MKSIEKLKITQLGKAELSKRELNRLVGGDGCCICGCRGSSSNSDNGGANRRGGANGLVSPGGGTNHGGTSL
mgnify:FL=1|jgi:natural product precursor